MAWDVLPWWQIFVGRFICGGKSGMWCFIQDGKNDMRCLVRSGKSLWDVLSWMAWDALSGVANLCGMFCPGWQKWHGMFYPGMFCSTFFFSNPFFSRLLLKFFPCMFFNFFQARFSMDFF